MGRIELLDKITIDKIAAGEVIERPAAVVKELVENAIDAGADSITVEIKEGGTSYIRISDNGHGIEKEDIQKAFLRHSTSKIRTIDDLNSIGSLGFRGEALSSVSSVAQVELLTKTKDAITGSRYVINGGTEEIFEDISLNTGTSFIIRQLFYNIPARRKFLKSHATEASHVNDLITRLALSHPKITFRFINKGEQKLQTTGNGATKDMIYQVYGREIAANILEVNYKSNKVSIRGFIGKPVISRGKRDYENYFINGRYVKSALIAKAIEDAYKGYTMQHRYPFTVLHLEMDTAQIDINVHPTKMDVRFSEQNTVYNEIYHAILDALQEKDIIPKIVLPDPKKIENNPQIVHENKEVVDGHENLVDKQIIEKKNIASNKDKFTVNEVICKPHKNQNRYGSSLSQQQVEENLEYFMDKMKHRVSSYHDKMSSAEVSDKTQVYKFDTPVQQAKISDSVKHALHYNKEKKQEEVKQEEVNGKAEPEQEQLNLFQEKILEQSIELQYRLIGQVFGTYWMIEYQEQLYIIDQHAAHEKVLYEKTVKGLKTKEFSTQYVSPPIVLHLSMGEQQLLEKHMEQFTKIGFEIEVFGIDTFAIRGVPGNLFSITQEDLFIEMLDELGEVSKAHQASERITEKIASLSCKAAVKGNSKLSNKEVEHLISELLKLENPFHCPHGRPTIISMTKKEMEKKFKRIV